MVFYNSLVQMSLYTHVAHGRTRPLAQGVVYINHTLKGFDDSLIRIPIERSQRSSSHLIF